jgi:hypothetical protein
MANRLWKSARDLLLLLLALPLRCTLFRVDYFLSEHVRHIGSRLQCCIPTNF